MFYNFVKRVIRHFKPELVIEDKLTDYVRDTMNKAIVKNATVNINDVDFESNDDENKDNEDEGGSSLIEANASVDPMIPAKMKVK